MLEITNVTRRFGANAAVKSVTLTIPSGQMVGVIGASGAGKSTLLRMINRLIDPSEGRVWIFGDEITATEGSDLRAMRAEVAMIFQQFNLVKRHTVITNVLSGALGRSPLLNSLLVRFSDEERAQAQAYLERVGLGDRGGSRADALSGGQQQRVAIARALMQKPRLVLADEPVASLDPALRHSVMRHIEALNREEGMTVICTLHDIDLIERYATRVVALRDGELVYEGEPTSFDAVTFRQIYGEDAVMAGSTVD